MPFVVPSLAGATTGNARGIGAVDLQQKRNSATKIASGVCASIGGGYSNTSSGVYNAVAGGYNNNAASTYSSIGGGRDNNTTATKSVISGGQNNVTYGSFSTIPGGYYGKANNYGQLAYASGRFAALGDAQTSTFVSRRSTTDATQSELFLDGSSERMTIATDTTWAFTMLIVARRTDADNESAAYEIKGCIDNNAGTTALVGSIATTVIAEDNAAWDVTAEADNTNDALAVKVTGEAAKTIRWVATVWMSQVTG